MLCVVTNFLLYVGLEERMTYKSKYLKKILMDDKTWLVNADLIERLLNNNKLDKLIQKIPNMEIRIICPQLYGKEFLNGNELFLTNLDYFIDYMTKQTMIPYSFSELFLSCCLESKYATFLITNDYIHNDIDTLYKFRNQSDMLIATAFSKKILNIYPKISDELKRFNIDNKTFEFNSKYQRRLIIELFKGIIITNNENLVDILPKLLMDFSQLKRNSKNIYAMCIYEDAWLEALNNLTNKFFAMKELYKFTELTEVKECED